jgi:hypothetical protein
MGRYYEQQLQQLNAENPANYSHLAMDVAKFLISTGYLQNAQAVAKELQQQHLLQENEQLTRLLNVIGTHHSSFIF